MELPYPLKFERSYNSHTITNTATGVYTRPLGYGWTHNYDIGLIFPGDVGGEADTLILKAPHGSRLRFSDNGDGTYSPYPGVLANLSQIGSVYIITAANQSVYTFGTSAGNPVRPRLLALRDPKGNETSFTYTADRLSRVTGPSASRWLDFSYDGQGRLDVLSDYSGRSLSYSYDTQDRLTAMTDARGLVWTYEYTSTTLSAGSGTTSLLHTVIDPEGRAVERTYYNEESRAIVQENGAGEAIVQIAYPDPFTRIVSEFGRVVTDTYDGRGLLIGQVDAEGNRQAYGLDGNFNRNSAQDGNGNRTSFVRNEFGYTTALTDALGNTSVFTYNTQNNLSALQDARGYVTHYTYDGNNNLTGVLNPLGDTAAFIYNGQGQVTTAQNENGHLTRFAYDEFGNTVAITDALGNVTAFGYDALGRLITSTDALGHITLSEYDAGDNLIRVIENYAPAQAQNHQNTYNLITRYAYDGANRPLLITDTLNRVIKYDYDAAGRLSRTTENHLPGQPQNHQSEYNFITQYGYDNTGRLILVTDTAGRQTRTTFGNSRNLVEQTIANYQDGVYDSANPDEDLITRYEYDAAGNLINVIDPLGRVARSEYDALNRIEYLIQNYQPGSSAPDANLTTRYAYDSTGNLSQIVNPKLVLSGAEVSQIVNYQYDPLNRLSAVIENYVTGAYSGIPDQDVTTRYGYDPVGNLSQIVNQKSQIVNYQYDPLNRSTAMQDPLGNQTQYGYDDLGNQSAITDANGLTAHFNYDAANRLSVIDYAGSTPDVTFAYNSAGNVLTMTDGLTPAATAYQYDSLNRLTQINDSFSQSLTYRYDSLSRRTHLIQPGNRSLSYTYDLADRLTTLSDWDGGQYHYAYDGAHQLTALEYPNGIETAYAYDGAGRLITLTHQSSSQTLARYVYTLDPLGNRLQAVESVLKPVAPIASPHFVYLPLIFKGGGGSGGPSLPPTRIIDYAYDNLNRLTNANYSTHSTGSGQAGETFAYAYDPVGNRLQMTNDQGQETNYQYDEANRLTELAVSGQPSAVSYAWDNNGNLLNDGNRAFTYDAANRLTQVVSGSLTAQLEYNGLGDRTRQWVHGVETQYLFDPVGLTQVLAESTGGQTTHYLPGLAQHANNAWTYQLPDPLGSVRQLVDANRQVTLAQSYTPFGNVLEQIGAASSGFGYTGEQQDPLTQLIYLRARHYDPMTGRFLTKDPFPGFDTQPSSLHPYQYAYNNPLRYIDPSGKNPLCFALVAADGPAPFGDAACAVLLAYTLYAGVAIAQNVDIPTNFTPPFPSTPPRIGPVPPFDLGPCPDPTSFPAPTLGEIEPLILTFPLGEGNQEIQTLAFPGITLELPSFLTASKYKKPKRGARGKQGATDIPSWAKGERPFIGEIGREFAKRLLDKKYGPVNYPTGPGSEFNRLRKYADRHFQ